MEVLSPGATNGQVPSTLIATVDPNLVVEYIIELLETTLGASIRDLEASGSLLSKAKKSDTIQRCARWASETQVVLYVQKDVSTTEQTNGVNGSSGRHRIFLAGCSRSQIC
jgi:dynein heavy chain 1